MAFSEMSRLTENGPGKKGDLLRKLALQRKCFLLQGALSKDLVTGSCYLAKARVTDIRDCCVLVCRVNNGIYEARNVL